MIKSSFGILRTSSFRLALQSAALSAFGAILVFAIIFNASENTVRGEIDSTVASDAADVISDSREDGVSLLKSVQDETAESVGTFYALTGPDGAELAGNLTIPPKVAAFWHGDRTIRPADGIKLPRHVTAIRGVASKFADGETLYVAENASALPALNHLIRTAFVAVFGTILAIGVAGGLLVAQGALHRVDTISKTSRDIMGGDLSRRIPLTGTGDEFDRLAENLNAMLDRIQALMENLRQVSNDIAHDLRSPLARLREYLELSRQNAQEPATRHAFDEGILQVDSALNIFGAMLRIAEIEAGARRRDFQAVDISKLLADLAETFETVADSEGMTMAVTIAPGLAAIGDRELLTQMFVNIIENAIRHSPAGSHINMTAEADPAGWLSVMIGDNGPGIPLHEYKRVLKRFVRLDASRHSPGSGLGLSLVAAVVELHQGQIDLSDNNPGLKVVVTLTREPEG
jgi:signal transduction histidine kinase